MSLVVPNNISTMGDSDHRPHKVIIIRIDRFGQCCPRSYVVSDTTLVEHYAVSLTGLGDEQSVGCVVRLGLEVETSGILRSVEEKVVSKLCDWWYRHSDWIVVGLVLKGKWNI